MRISDWSSDVCSSDLKALQLNPGFQSPAQIALDKSRSLRIDRAALHPVQRGSPRRNHLSFQRSHIGFQSSNLLRLKNRIEALFKSIRLHFIHTCLPHTQKIIPEDTNHVAQGKRQKKG